MRPILAAVSLLAALLVSSSTALAQADREAAAPLEDRPAIKLNEVERGLFFGVEGGGLLLFGPTAKTKTGFSTGRSLALTVGGDLGDSLSLALLLMGAEVNTPAGFVGPQDMGGDFSSLILGGLGQVALVSMADSNGVKRFFVTARAGAGLGLMGPKGFFQGADVVVLGGAGLQYFTHLRHFSIGLDADFMMGVKNIGPGVLIAPNVRYTF